MLEPIHLPMSLVNVGGAAGIVINKFAGIKTTETRGNDILQNIQSIQSNVNIQSTVPTTFTTTIMQSASSSTASLLSSNKSSSKNWESSFAQLSSSYGFSGAVPSLPSKSSTMIKTTTTTSVPSAQSFTSSTTVVRPTKDYESAFGQLSSNYGFGGAIPSLPPTKPKKSSKQSPPSPSPQHAVLHSATSPKDYGAAFGNLSSSYGFGGPASTLFTRN